ncbi:unnamed protein product [Gongylonema pulchrum]|uniref:FH2 domain-containing protein n=1 Tax=Gongylonema pulchrum TaxID=637853 RepID=A0A183D0A8_9BILA|nr:unnamed protein product [Gongylonema pulchrum]
MAAIIHPIFFRSAGSFQLAYFAKLKSGKNLKDAELFCFLAAREPFLKLQIELKVLASNVSADLTRQLDSARVLLCATEDLYSCASIKTFFHRCLQYGNFLNQSTFAAGASGFALTSLLSALNTKGNGPTSNIRLVDILAENADNKIRSAVNVLSLLESAKKCSVDDLEKSELGLRRSLEKSLKNVQECGDASLFAHYSPIIMDSITKCGQLTRTLKKIRDNELRLKEYYCGPTMNLEAILETLYQAFKLFQNALNVR